MPMFILLIIVGFIVSTACTHEPDLSNAPVVSYANNVQPILIANCTQSGCHGAGNSELFKLLDYNGVIRHVNAGDARGSKLYKAITAYGALESQMPPPPNRHLNDEEVTAIFLWIQQGAKNN